MNYKICALFLCLGSLVFAPNVVLSQEIETIPIPPRRPDVLSVSPEYIQELLKQKKESQKSPSPSTAPQKHNIDKSNQVPAPSLPRFDTLIDLPTKSAQSARSNTNLVDLDGSSILSILEEGGSILNSDTNDQAIPAPRKKPNSLETSRIPEAVEDFAEESALNTPISVKRADSSSAPDERFSALIPAAGDSEQSVVSFMLVDGQIYLNEDLKLFLKNYALKMFRENNGLVMDIQAYAPLVDGQEYSDVRVSLARALEVRSFLLEHNISASRLKISPMGRDKTGQIHNRIDLVFLK